MTKSVVYCTRRGCYDIGDVCSAQGQALAHADAKARGASPGLSRFRLALYSVNRSMTRAVPNASARKPMAYATRSITWPMSVGLIYSSLPSASTSAVVWVDRTSASPTIQRPRYSVVKDKRSTCSRCHAFMPEVERRCGLRRVLSNDAKAQNPCRSLTCGGERDKLSVVKARPIAQSADDIESRSGSS